MKKLMLTICLVFGLLIAPMANADTVNVTYLGVEGNTIVSILSPHYTGGAYAGIYGLTVNGIPTDSFCIDVVDNPGPANTLYDVLALATAPVPGGPMGATKALDIEKLWAMAYAPTMTTAQAVALQLAIWEVVVDSTYDLDAGDFQSATTPYSTEAQNLLDGLSGFTGTPTPLVALSNSSYQDFAVMPVPEPGILILLGIALSAVGLASRRRKS